jgi:hypothetical protein
VHGGERQDLVCGRNVRLVDLDLQNRRRIGTLLCKTAGDPDLRGDSSGSGRIFSRENNIVLCRDGEVFLTDIHRRPDGGRTAGIRGTFHPVRVLGYGYSGRAARNLKNRRNNFSRFIRSGEDASS